jgi:hypothetical protein
MNPCRKNGNTFVGIRSGLALLHIRTTGHTSFNSTLNEFGVWQACLYVSEQFIHRMSRSGYTGEMAISNNKIWSSMTLT